MTVSMSSSREQPEDAVAGDAGVVHEHVDRAPSVSITASTNVVGVGRTADRSAGTKRNRSASAGSFAHASTSGGGRPRAGGDAVAGVEEGVHDAGPEAPAAAGDDHRLGGVSRLTACPS